MKVYVVLYKANYGDYSQVDKIFLNREGAENFVRKHEKSIDSQAWYSIEEIEVKE